MTLRLAQYAITLLALALAIWCAGATLWVLAGVNLGIALINLAIIFSTR